MRRSYSSVGRSRAAGATTLGLVCDSFELLPSEPDEVTAEHLRQVLAALEGDEAG
jgi:hypothetical protein